MPSARKCLVLEQSSAAACADLGGSSELQLSCWFWDPSACDFEAGDNFCRDLGISAATVELYAACTQ